MNKRAEKRREAKKAARAGEPRTVHLAARGTVMWPLLAISIAGAGLLLIAGAQAGAFGAAAMAAMLLVINAWYVWQAIAAPASVTLTHDTFTVSRRGKAIYEGPYFGIAPTVMPAKGVGLATPPLPMGTTLSLAFSHPFVMSATRHRIAFPGVFVAGAAALLPDEAG